MAGGLWALKREGAEAFRPLNETRFDLGFSPGSRLLPADPYATAMSLARQEFRTYFLTFVTAQRRRLFQVDANARMFVETAYGHQAKERLALHAFVVMPDHVHLLLTPAPDLSLEKAVQFLKGGFSFRLQSKRDVWERGFIETRVVDSDAYDGFRVYIEQNPVRAGLAVNAAAHEFSSAHRGVNLSGRPAWFCQG